jgi:hypothetical protein
MDGMQRDKPLKKSGLYKFATVKSWFEESPGRNIPNYGVDVLAKTEDDLRCIMTITRTKYVDYMQYIAEYTAPTGLIAEFYPELN